MPPIVVNQFKGYTSEKDGIVNNPAVAEDCENIIINNGDICNIPYAKKKFAPAFWSIANELLTSHYYMRKSAFVVAYNSDGGNTWVSKKDSTGDYTTFYEVDTGAYMAGYSANFFKNWGTPEERPPSGNFVQVGDWLLFLAEFGLVGPDSGAIELPYNMRFKWNDNNNYIVFPLGIRAPDEVTVPGTAAGNVSGTFDIAVSFVTHYDDDTVDDGIVIGVQDIESDYTPLDASATYVNEAITIRIYLPEDHTTLVPTGFVGVGIYTKQDTQSTYYLHKYITSAPDAGPALDAGRWYIEYILDDATINQLVDVTGSKPISAASIPTLGNRNSPRPAWHGAFYKNRMYYASIPASSFLETTDRIRNRLEYSQSTPLDDPTIHRYVNYIEGQEFVGNDAEAITGLIVYNDMLIVFKQKSTWILTDDINVGKLRIIPGFESIGCTNVDGGKAYVVEDGKLFFGSLDGIFMWSGSGEPIDISAPIKEDLNDIEFNRYGFMRLGIDPRYNLLYVTFPWGYIGERQTDYPAFIFNYREMAWTRTYLGEYIRNILVERQKEAEASSFNYRYSKPLVYFDTLSGLHELDILENDATAGTRSWSWQSSKLTGKRPAQKKHFKFFKLATETSFNAILIKSVIANGSTQKNIQDLKTNLHIGIKSENVNIKLAQTNVSKSFRISGFELDAHLIGRR